MSRHFTGLIWRGTYLDALSPQEAAFWDWNPLPFGWAIVHRGEPRSRADG